MKKENKIVTHTTHYAVVGSGAIKGFTWVDGLCGPTFLPSKAAAYAAAVEYAEHGYVPSWDKLATKPSREKKNNRTILALANILSCPVYEIKGVIPLLGGKGSVHVDLTGWRHDGEGMEVVEQVRMDFNRLPSGRIGRWTRTSIDTDDSSPNYGEEWITTGKGQW